MGQYYRPVLIDLPLSPTSKYVVLSRTIDGKYTAAKLTEHSWFGGPLCDTIGHMIYKNPMCIAWIGDYSENEELFNIDSFVAKGITFNDVWGEGVEGIDLHGFNFEWQDKYIINVSKKCYINVNHYWNGSVILVGKEKEPWVINPIPILTSVGNGRGGGDYRGLCMDYVGTWAGDIITVEDNVLPGFEEFVVAFKEECYCE